MTEILLEGCRTRPVLSYLKALGLLAAVAEQLDADATGRWQSGRFVLTLGGGRGLDELVDFVSERYAPPPILSPWNSRGGFRTDRKESSETRLEQLEQHNDPRLEPYRRAIAQGRKLWREAEARGLITEGSIDTKRKAEFVRLCRSWLPDDALPWLDAAVVLVEDDAVYPALLGGTGGNFGSGDLSSNAHEAALWLVNTHPDRCRRFVVEALAGRREGVALVELLPGQLDPGATGGVNMGPGEKLTNPVEFLLGLHGASLFASGVARRLGGRPNASVPFTVDVSRGVVRTMADGEKVRAELWLPEWHRPMTFAELRQLLAEGRAQWAGRQSTTSLDFARAAATFGVDRDIRAFNRFLVAERLGQANLAVPVGRFVVRQRRGVELTSAVDLFLDQVDRVSNPTQAVRGAANRLRRSMFELVDRDTARNARTVLAALYELERAVGRSSSARKKVPRPFAGLRAVDWFGFFEGESTAEFRVAVAVASQRDPRWEAQRGRLAAEMSAVPLWCRPVARAGYWPKDGDATMLLGWSESQPLVDLLGPDVRGALREGWLLRALRCAQNPPPEGGVEKHGEDRGAADWVAEGFVADTPGIDVAFGAAVPCPLEDVVAYGLGDFDDGEYGEWLRALVMLDWTGFAVEKVPWKNAERRDDGFGLFAIESLLGPVFALNAPFFARWPLRLGDDTGARIRFHPVSEHVAAIARGDAPTALRFAATRMRQYGLDVPQELVPRANLATSLVLDAALVPMGRADLNRVVHASTPSFPEMTSTVQEEIA